MDSPAGSWSADCSLCEGQDDYTYCCDDDQCGDYAGEVFTTTYFCEACERDGCGQYEMACNLTPCYDSHHLVQSSTSWLSPQPCDQIQPHHLTPQPLLQCNQEQQQQVPTSRDQNHLEYDVPSVPKQPINKFCRWPVLGGYCNKFYDDASELQDHIDTEHLSPLERIQFKIQVDTEGQPKESSAHGFFCQWEDCRRNHIDYTTENNDSFLDEGYQTISTDSNKERCFPTKAKLRRHTLTHSGFKPFKCGHCGMEMKTQDAIDKHIRTHTGERPYPCLFPDCGKSFTTASELKNHKTLHTGEKKYKCKHCVQVFADSSNLAKHEKIHSEPIYCCQDCGAKQARADQLKRHIESAKHMGWLRNNPVKFRAYTAGLEAAAAKKPKGPILPGRVVKSRNRTKRGFSRELSASATPP